MWFTNRLLEMTEGRLRVRVAAYEREKTWAPRYVADELQATYDALHRTQADTVIWGARADATTNPDEKTTLTAAAEQARTDAERYSGQMAAARVDDESLDPANVSVGGVDGLAAAHVHLTHGDGVTGDGLGDGSAARTHTADGRAAHPHPAAEAVVGPVVDLSRGVAAVGAGCPDELGLLRGVELLELRSGAAQPDLSRRAVEKVERDEPAGVSPVLRLDD